MKSESAVLLEPLKIQAITADTAKKHVLAPLVNSGQGRGQAYAVIYQPRTARSKHAELISAHHTFIEAYRKANVALGAADWRTREMSTKGFRTRTIANGDVVLFFGKPSPHQVNEGIGSSGVFIMPEHLNEDVLSSLDLPRLPENSPVLLQVKNVESVSGIDAGSISGSPTLETSGEELTQDAVAWREEFMRTVKCWTAKQVAKESTSQAANKSAIASRWQRENKIFSVKFRGQQYFPQFQFEGGSPSRVLAKVIKCFPAHASGWTIAFFFANPNPYIDGHKPLNLIRSNPDRVVSLAERYVHPADVF